MKINAIITCVNYADFLCQTLPYNMQQVDAARIVTTPDDYLTDAVVWWEVTRGMEPSIAHWHVNEKLPMHSHHVTITKTNKFHENGAAFNKGKAINEAIFHPQAPMILDGWVLFIDADMVLPKDFRQVMMGLEPTLDPECLYGTPRFICPTAAEWRKFVAEGRPTEGVQGRPGWRKQHHRERGNHGSKGYFQLFHSKAKALRPGKWYPEDFDTAGGSDRAFYKYFEPSGKVGTLRDHVTPIEIHADYWNHVVDEWEEDGVNWKGRRTPYFV